MVCTFYFHFSEYMPSITFACKPILILYLSRERTPEIFILYDFLPCRCPDPSSSWCHIVITFCSCACVCFGYFLCACVCTLEYQKIPFCVNVCVWRDAFPHSHACVSVNVGTSAFACIVSTHSACCFLRRLFLVSAVFWENLEWRRLIRLAITHTSRTSATTNKIISSNTMTNHRHLQ